jgi:predicted DNA-binding protein
MPISLRIPAYKEEIIKRLAKKTGKTKTAVILEAIDEKIGIKKNRKETIRDLAGWMSPEEAQELKESMQIFNQVHERDWE